MARKGKRGASSPQLPELDEVDAFAADQEKVLLEEAGEYGSSRPEEEDEDEEVMRVDTDQSDSEEESVKEEDDEEASENEKEGQGWGSRANYYGGDEIEDPETAKKLTEEAMKLQKKHLEALGMEEYVDEDMMEDWSKTAQEFDDKATNKLAIVINEDGTDLDKLDKSEKMELLTQSFPEFIPLLKEFQSLQYTMKVLSAASSESGEVKKIALTAYLGALSSYFSIFIDHVHIGEPFLSMKDHPVMETILTTRQIWTEVQKVGDGPSQAERGEQEEDDAEDMDEFVDAEAFESEEEGIHNNDINEDGESEEESESESESESDEEVDISSKRQIKSVSDRKSGDFDEVDTPDEVDMEEKQRRKKSLRFYTSKIDQSQLKNAEKFSGDLDLPYKERLFERKQRLLEEARKRGLGQDKAQLGDDLDDHEFNSDDEREAQGVNDDIGGNNYYNNLKKVKDNKVAARHNAHKAAVKAAKEGKLADAEEYLGKDGKRALNYQILKNKGLTSKKKKEIRNARVKKRNKYDQAKKKLKSVRQVYDDSNRGPYAGEKTGIKKGLSRSVKLA